MKKIFSILAAAIIALSFASCEKSDVNSKYFKIKISDITDSSAVFKVTPADTSLYYGLMVADMARVKTLTQDTIIAEYFNYVDYYYQNGATLESMEGMIFKGVLQDTLDVLPANTEIAVIAFQLLEKPEHTLAIGGVTLKSFKTKSVKVVGTKDLGKLEYSDFYDYRDYDGSFEAYGWNLDEDENYTAYLGLCLIDDDFKGNYTFADVYVQYSGIWLPEFGGSVEASRVYIADAKITGTYDEAKEIGKLSGWVVGANGIKYSFSFEYSTGDSGRAPFRIATKREMTHEGNGILPKIPTYYNRIKK